MANPEMEQSELVQEKFLQVKKEIKELKQAIDRNEKLRKEVASQEAHHESVDLFIERKEQKKKGDADEQTAVSFDKSPGDHVLVEL